MEQSPLPATMGLKARPKAQPATPTRMITGAQIKAARLLLGWGPSKLAQRAKLPSAVIHRAESVDGEPPITLYQAALIRNALERFGVEFTYGDSPGVRLSAK